MGMGTDSDKITFAPTRVGLLLAPATPYGATGEDAPSLGRLLTSAGFATSAVPPERAVASLRRTIPQILVVADDVPGVDAFALIRDLRSEHRTRGIALVLLLHPDAASGKMDEDALYRAWQAGVDCLLSLPCAPAELVEFVRRIDRKARAQQCMVIATDLGWRGEATDCLRYLRAALQMGGEEIREEVRRNVAFRRLARSVEFRDLVGEEPRET